MSEAFRCDGCREYYSGRPAFEGSITGRTFVRTGDGPETGGRAKISHKAGANDYNPREDPAEEVPWPVPVQSKNFALCVGCFLEHLYPGVLNALPDRGGDRDE